MTMARALGIAAAGSMLAGCVFFDADGDSRTNHAPTVQPASVTVPEDLVETLEIHAEDVDGDDLELTMYSAFGGEYDLERITQTTVNGTNQLTAEVDLRGFPNFYGEGEFEVGVTDGIERASATIEVTIVPRNDRPTARDDAFATLPGTELLISGATLLANDDDAADVREHDAPLNRGLTIASVAPSTHGSVSYVAGTVRFVPEPGFVGNAPFKYRITDGEDTAEATIRVLVGGINAAPLVVGTPSIVLSRSSVDLDVGRLLHNDLDDDGHTLTVIAVGNPEHGTVSLVGRTITFTPIRFFGTAGFEYTVTDGAATATGHVIVEVAPWI